MTRRRFQRGSIYKKGKRKKVWVARFFEDVIAPDGTLTRIRRSERLGTITEIPTRRQAEQLLQDRLRLLTAANIGPVPRARCGNMPRNAGCRKCYLRSNTQPRKITSTSCECTFIRRSETCSCGSSTVTWCRILFLRSCVAGCPGRRPKVLRTALGTLMGGAEIGFIPSNPVRKTRFPRDVVPQSQGPKLLLRRFWSCLRPYPNRLDR